MLVAALAALAGATIGARWLVRPAQIAQIKRGALDISLETKLATIAFMGALYGRNLSQSDVADLSDRLDFRIANDEDFPRDCEVLVQHLDAMAGRLGAATFRACDDSQRDSIVQRIMTINNRSLVSRLLAHLSSSQYQYYRIRWWTVAQLTWIYRQSAAAWRARGYTRWPGIPGDWHDVLAPGAPYP
jgi:hypothetical protein